MKTGFGIQRKLRTLTAYINVFRFCLLKYLLGFDSASNFLTRIDKTSLKMVLKRNGATIGRNCDIENGLIFHNCSKQYSNLYIGNNCHIGKNCFFDLRGKVVIEDNVVISMQVAFITHLDMNKSKLKNKFPANHNDITVKKDAYIGTRATILSGVSIHNCSVIAAGALVLKDVPPCSVVAGIPARFIKRIII